MKKKSRRPRSFETSQRQSSRTQTTGSVSEEKSPPERRPRKTVPVTTDTFYQNTTAKDKTADLDCSVTAADDTQKHPESKSRSSGECLSTRKPHSIKKAAEYSCFAYQQTFSIYISLSVPL